jgi:two-component system, sensor histidine kinase and response regulator
MRIAAHDLRNLLVVINGYSEIALAKLDDPEKSLRRIVDASDRMKAIIEDFLALQTLERNEGEKQKVFDLRPLIEQVLDQATLTAHSKGISFSPDLPAGPLPAVGNVGHTHQILTNYTTNATKYSRPGARTRISVRARDHHWRISVRDQGPGIAPAERGKLFMAFARISNKPTCGEVSTGLGLSIVKTLAEGQGGKVGAEFPDEGGSVFWLELPTAPSTEVGQVGSESPKPDCA